MPLSTPVNRKLLHTRKVICEGYQRDDGLMEIEGHLIDTKSYDFPNHDRGGHIAAGDHLHDISARITLDKSLTIVEAEACMDYTPYHYCKKIPPVFSQIVGIQIGAGWMGKIRSVMGGTKGCTHITELLGPMATTAFQTMVSISGPDRIPEENQSTRERAPVYMNSCHSYASSSPVIKVYWPEFYDGEEIGEAG